MSANPLAIKQNSELALSKANRMLDAANKILSQESTGLDKADELWMRNLGVWDRGNGDDHSYRGPRAEKLFPIDRYFPDLTFSNVTNHWLINGGYYRIRGDKMVHIPNYHILDFYTPDIAAKLFNKGWYLPHLSFKILPVDRDRLLNLRRFTSYLSTSYPHVPKDIGNLVNLRYLVFSGCREHATFPKEIGNLVNLQSLSITGFRFKLGAPIPIEIGNLVNLKRLDLSNNNLWRIPEEITNLSNLTNLNLRQSRFCGEQLQLSETQKRWIEGIDTVRL